MKFKGEWIMGFCKRKGVECECLNNGNNCNSDNCYRNLPDMLTFGFMPNANIITGIVDTETDGKKFAIGTKNNATGFVLNFGNRSCLLFTGNVAPIDLRQFNFDEFTSIEINGNKFVKENQNV
jgi:hypothetical protein